MSNLQKFNQTLKELDDEVMQLKGISNAYQKLQQLATTFEETIKQFDNNSEILNKLLEVQRSHQENNLKTLAEIKENDLQKYAAILQQIDIKYDHIATENKLVYNKLFDLQKTYQTKITGNLEDIANTTIKSSVDITKLIDEKTERIRYENKEFYKDIERTISIVLNENKSEIKRLIENERIQLKYIIESQLEKKGKEILSSFEVEINKQSTMITSQYDSIRKLIVLIGAFTIIICTLTIYKMLI